MKSIYENSAYKITPETSDEERELKKLIARFSSRGVTSGDYSPTNRSRPSGLARNTAD